MWELARVRLQLFLHRTDLPAHAKKINDVLAAWLPATFCGYPTNLAPVGDHGTRRMRRTDGRIRHGVVVADLGDWLSAHLGFNPLTGITTFDWLATPTQALAEVTAGAVFHDGLGQLQPVRRLLGWYPDDLRSNLLACQWQRLSQEEAFVGRCGEAGDELGSALITARLARELMRLCLLMARRYPPYSMWLGSAFAQLPCAPQLTPILTAAVTATTWPGREGHLAAAYETVAALHNTLGLTPPTDPRTRRFHDRPFRVLHAERLAVELFASLTDDAVRALPPIGSIDQYVDSTDVLCDRPAAVLSPRPCSHSTSKNTRRTPRTPVPEPEHPDTLTPHPRHSGSRQAENGWCPVRAATHYDPPLPSVVVGLDAR